MQSAQEESREYRDDRGGDGGIKVRHSTVSEVTNGGEGEEGMGKESLMMELTRLVQMVIKDSSWWERRGVDCSILTAAFFCLLPGKE